MGERLIGGLAVHESGDPADPGVLLWPGLGSSAAYFAPLTPRLPWRSVAVDPPGTMGSPPLHPCTSVRLIEAAREIAEACGCHAVVGHSLGAHVAVGMAADPPAGLRAAVLLDGGFLDAQAFVEMGMPATSTRDELAAWMESVGPRFPDWDAAYGAVAEIIGSEPTPAIQAYVRDQLAEVDGEIRERNSRERMADLLLGTLDHDVLARAERIQTPTLLIVGTEPAERRPLREKAWTQLAAASTMIELEVVEGWRHNAILQDPERATGMIRDWLAGHLAS